MNLQFRFRDKTIEGVEDAITVIKELEDSYEMSEAERIIRFFESYHGIIITRDEDGYYWTRKN